MDICPCTTGPGCSYHCPCHSPTQSGVCTVCHDRKLVNKKHTPPEQALTAALLLASELPSFLQPIRGCKAADQVLASPAKSMNIPKQKKNVNRPRRRRTGHGKEG